MDYINTLMVGSFVVGLTPKSTLVRLEVVLFSLHANALACIMCIIPQVKHWKLAASARLELNLKAYICLGTLLNKSLHSNGKRLLLT